MPAARSPEVPQTFAGKVIAVAGASRGTGLATARQLLARGASVSISSSSPDNIAAAKTSLLEEHPDAADRIHTCAADITNLEEVEAWIAAVMQRFGRIDGCANVSGKE